jgi:hypothetical protein
MAETDDDRNGSRSEAEAAPGVTAFFRKWVCEQHPDKPWPHDDCAGPGMPPLRAFDAFDDEGGDRITSV